MKVLEAGRIVSVAVIVAVSVNADGVREVLGMAVGPAEPFYKSARGAEANANYRAFVRCFTFRSLC